MADEIPEETKASQEILKEGGRTAKDFGRGVLDLARRLVSGRTEKGREMGPSAPGRKGAVVIDLFGAPAPENGISVVHRDPFEHLRIAQRQAERDLKRLYREVKRRADRGDPMDVTELSKRENGIMDRMGPDREAVATRMRERTFSEGPMLSDRAPVRMSRETDARRRTARVPMERGAAVMAMSGLSKGPRAPAPIPIAVLAKGIGGVGR